jgi:hypothetical protein
MAELIKTLRRTNPNDIYFRFAYFIVFCVAFGVIVTFLSFWLSSTNIKVH